VIRRKKSLLLRHNIKKPKGRLPWGLLCKGPFYHPFLSIVSYMQAHSHRFSPPPPPQREADLPDGFRQKKTVTTGKKKKKKRRRRKKERRGGERKRERVAPTASCRRKKSRFMFSTENCACWKGGEVGTATESNGGRERVSRTLRIPWVKKASSRDASTVSQSKRNTFGPEEERGREGSCRRTSREEKKMLTLPSHKRNA